MFLKNKTHGLLPAIPGETENSREGEAVFGICQTVVAGVLADSTLTPVQTGENLCTGDLTEHRTGEC